MSFPPAFNPSDGTQTYFASARIPFFFNPNFGALVKPLDAALRTQSRDPNFSRPDGETIAKPDYEPIQYAEFLKKKAANNFVTGKSRYD